MYFTGLAVRLLPLDLLVRQFVQVTQVESHLPPEELPVAVPLRAAVHREEHLPLRAVVHREEHLPLREAAHRREVVHHREVVLLLAQNLPANTVVIALPSFLPASSC